MGKEKEEVRKRERKREKYKLVAPVQGSNLQLGYVP